MTTATAHPAPFWDRLREMPDSVLVANYHVGPEWVNLFVLRAGRIHPYRIPFRDWQLPRLTGLSPARTRGLGAPPPTPLPEGSSLIEPILDHLQGCSLVYVIPHGPLEHYPLHALAVRGQTLVDLCPVVYLPCLSMMPPASPNPPMPSSALVMGNMTSDLPGAEEEAQQVAALFGVTPHLRDEATLERLFRETPGKNLVHIAGHGYFDPSQALSSGVPFPDGILTVKRVYDLRLDQCLVVLSGCVTGLGDERPGEGFSSLVGAFFAAGARGMLVSLWNVDDWATSRFMLGMYERVTRRGTSFPEALRGSYLEVRQLALSREGPGATPFYWAPFKPVGDW